MCGIVGFYSNTRGNGLVEDLDNATLALRHRGPDQSGTYIQNDDSRCVGLGHRRLSIIDLSQSGAQPMESADGNVVVVFNGEIYNFNALKKELLSQGFHFKTKTDTEVIVNAYLQWGVSCFQRFIGMFAICIYDRLKKKIYLVRDRIGIKPVYYYRDRDVLIFGSELKALMAFQRFPRNVNRESVASFLHYQYIPAPQTIFRDTCKLPPGNILEYDGNGLEIRPFWSLPLPSSSFAATRDFDEKSVLQTLDDLVSTAVSDRLVSDVPIGALLSGGIDSSVVVALMQKNMSSAVKTFSIGFSEENYNEAPWANKVAHYLGTDHTELYLEPGRALDMVPRLPEIYDEPFADPSALPTYLVSCLTKSYVTVALSGDGGDEQFGGYARYWATHYLHQKMRHVPVNIRVPISRALACLSPATVAEIYNRCLDYLPKKLQVTNFQDKWEKLIRQLTQGSIIELYRMAVCIWSEDALNDLIGALPPVDTFKSAFEQVSGLSAVLQCMYVDQHTYLPDAMLTKVDRASMSNGLEIRVPLLDHRIVEFVSQLPQAVKMPNGSAKFLLKKVLARYLPESLFDRPKMGFGVPIDSWLRTDLKDLLLDYLSVERLKKEGWFNTSLVERLISEHLSGVRSHHHRLWALLMWELWRERWMV